MAKKLSSLDQLGQLLGRTDAKSEGEPKQSGGENLVYSTETGRVRSGKSDDADKVLGSGKVRVCRERKGRAGKTVTVIYDLPLTQSELKVLAKELKQSSGGGGAVKECNIELQGDHCTMVLDALLKKGFAAKISG